MPAKIGLKIAEIAAGEGRWRDNYGEVNHKAECLYKEFKQKFSKE